MLNYFVLGLANDGMYHYGYPTPGFPVVLTSAGCASSKDAAERECARLNEAQIVDRRAAMVRKANLIVREKEH